MQGPNDPIPSLTMGEPYRPWMDGACKNVTFILTEDCQLRCRYCYIVGKNSTSRMPFDVAARTIDYLLSDRKLFPDAAVIWEFIGGEPLMEIELMERVTDYAKSRMYELDHPWFNAYRLSLTTNGLLYDDRRVQRFIENNRAHLSIGLTLDGTPRKHDAQRVYANGRGSYDQVVRNIPLWLAQFPNASTKATIAHDDLPYVKESVLHLWGLGIKTININVVFEDVWQEGDAELFEEQLIELADEILRNDLYRKHNVSFFGEWIGKPLDPEHDRGNWCGAGKMLAVDHEGNFYPCIRFAPYSLSNRPARTVGNCFTGIDPNRLRPFEVLDRVVQSPPECLTCEVASGCAWCQAANYDTAATDTIFQRATYLCAMHKARVRANDYFWRELRRKEGLPPAGAPAAPATEERPC